MPISLHTRQVDCPVGQIYYNCFWTDFIGCCADDPCDHGICLSAGSEDNGKNDDDQSDDNTTSASGSSMTVPFEGRSTTMTDSGITHTVPNDDVVTVTRHTTVVTERRSSTSAITSTELTSPTETALGQPTPFLSSPTSVLTPQETGASTLPGKTLDDSLPKGTIIGIAAGGGIALILVFLAMFFIWRHSKISREQANSNALDGAERDELVEGKHFPSVSAQTTGTAVRPEVDPFAPFGGRVDHDGEHAISQPPSCVFEMDGTSAAPVELPAAANNASEIASNDEIQPQSGRYPSQTTHGHPSGMAANLNGLGHAAGRPFVVGHWNQYGAPSQR